MHSLIFQAGSLLDHDHSADGRGRESDQANDGHAQAKDGSVGCAVAAPLATFFTCREHTHGTKWYGTQTREVTADNKHTLLQAPIHTYTYTLLTPFT